MKGGKRVWLVVVVSAVSLTACRDNGLPDRNLPLEEARHRTYGYDVYQPAPATPPVAVGGRHWMGSLPDESIPARLLVPVGSAGGASLFALRGQEAPYTRLYAPVGENRWRPYLRIN